MYTCTAAAAAAVAATSMAHLRLQSQGPEQAPLAMCTLPIGLSTNDLAGLTLQGAGIGNEA
jgi:hypothetical protein